MKGKNRTVDHRGQEKDGSIHSKKSFSARSAKYVFALPGLTFFTFAMVIPFFMGLNIAFTDWNGITRDYNYVGLKNFINMFRDSRLLIPARNALIFALIGPIANNVLALSLALMINQHYKKFTAAAKLLFFIPVCLSSVLSAFIWNFIYKHVFSSLFHVNSPLGSKTWVIPAIILIGLWNGVGVGMMIYLSALKSIPGELYESAKVDGASAMQRFFRITIPMLTPAYTTCITLSLTNYLREFATTLSATGGGPARSSETISIYIFDNLYTYNKAGYGQALSLAFMIALIIISTVVSSFFRKLEVEL